MVDEKKTLPNSSDDGTDQVGTGCTIAPEHYAAKCSESSVQSVAAPFATQRNAAPVSG